MKRKYLILTILTVIFAALTVLLSGCGGGDDALEGKNIVTFEINGGILNYGIASTDSKINYAYHPGTYIKDPSELPNYKISRSGYDFTGWYTSKDCKPSEKWDFTKPFDQETLTLYAGWEKSVKYTYSVNYTLNGETVTLGSYKVSVGERFEDFRKYADARDNYTSTGYFSDPECTIPWVSSTAHPGGESDLDIPVYVKYIEGNWKLVDSYDKLKSALKSGNVYLTKDINCEGGELYVSGDFNAIFEGNGYKVTNFTVNDKGTTFNPTLAIFESLASGADIRNVSFENVTFKFLEILDNPQVKTKVASLAVSIEEGVRITNVSVKGSLETDYAGELPCLNKVFYYTDVADEALLADVTNFNANIIIVNKQS